MYHVCSLGCRHSKFTREADGHGHEKSWARELECTRCTMHTVIRRRGSSTTKSLSLFSLDSAASLDPGRRHWASFITVWRVLPTEAADGTTDGGVCAHVCIPIKGHWTRARSQHWPANSCGERETPKGASAAYIGCGLVAKTNAGHLTGGQPRRSRECSDMRHRAVVRDPGHTFGIELPVSDEERKQEIMNDRMRRLQSDRVGSDQHPSLITSLVVRVNREALRSERTWLLYNVSWMNVRCELQSFEVSWTHFSMI